MATKDQIAEFVDQKAGSELNLFKQFKKKLGVAESAKYHPDRAYGDSFVSLSDLETRVKQKLESLQSNYDQTASL